MPKSAALARYERTASLRQWRYRPENVAYELHVFGRLCVKRPDRYEILIEAFKEGIKGRHLAPDEQKDLVGQIKSSRILERHKASLVALVH